MNFIKVVLVSLISAFVILGCSQSNEPLQEQWKSDEVFLQITELRKEVASLRQELKFLKANTLNKKSTPPRQLIKSFPLAEQVALGDEDAELAIVEFSDYQCPYCVRHAKQVYPDLKKNFIDTGKVKYFIRNFPLSFHAKARDAAIVAECSGKQGKQWDAHEYLFNNSRQLGDDTFNKLVEEFSLDKKQFNLCRKDKSISAKIDADMILGQQNGVSGTPKFFIGRIKNDRLIDVVPLNGAQPYKAFERVINALDKKS